MPDFIGIKDETPLYGEKLNNKGELKFYDSNFSQTFIVFSDDTTQTEVDILATSGVPQRFDQRNGITVEAREAEEIKTIFHPTTGVKAILWEVKVDYSSTVSKEYDEEQDPTARDPVTNWTFGTEEELLVEDTAGNKVRTVPGEKIAIMSPVALPILEIERYETFPFSPQTILDFVHTVNSAEFYGAPAEHAFFAGIDVREETIDDVKLNKVRYTIKFKFKEGVDHPWRARVLHEGNKYFLNAGDAEGVRAEDENNNYITVNLDTDGKRLASNAEPIFIEFERYVLKDWSVLNLGPFV